MASLGRLALVSLLLLALPLQTLTAAYLDLRGPAHFHLEHEEDDHHHGHWHSHDQGHVEHHYHHPHDTSVVTVHAGLDEPVLLSEQSGWSGTMLAALLTVDALPLASAARCGPAPRQESNPKSHSPERLERPPPSGPA
jgi:hypothetical protein